MHPIAASNNDDLVSFGLTTLEVYVDSLNIMFLEPLLADVFEDVLRALYALLRPNQVAGNDK